MRTLWPCSSYCFYYAPRAAVVHLNFRAGSTFPDPVCTVPSYMDRTSRCNKVDAEKLYASYRLNLLLLKGQRCVQWTYYTSSLIRRYKVETCSLDMATLMLDWRSVWCTIGLTRQSYFTGFVENRTYQIYKCTKSLKIILYFYHTKPRFRCVPEMGGNTWTPWASTMQTRASPDLLDRPILRHAVRASAMQ